MKSTWFKCSILWISAVIGQAQNNVTISVNTEQGRNPISPYVYGSNENKYSKNLGRSLTINRIGGNRLTGYNWENNWSNAGTDYFNINDNWVYFAQGLNSATWQNTSGSGMTHWIDSTVKYGSEIIVTVQAAGYVSADGNGAVNCTAPCNRWIPVYAQKPGGNFVYPPDKNDNAVYIDEYLDFLIKRYGRADQGGIKFYQMDNEPDLWHATHPRLFGTTRVTAANLFSKHLAYAKMIKAMDNSAQTLGLCSFGVWGWEYDLRIRDFLRDFKTQSDLEGQRLLDVVAVNLYPEHRSTTNLKVWDNNDVTDPVVTARVQAPRSLWDPTFIENSTVPSGAFGNTACRYVPRLRGYIDQYYPGTKLAITEWSYGAPNHISGGVAAADVLGIYGREGVYIANCWSGISGYLQSAFSLYRNYDGIGSTYGDLSVAATTTSNQNSSVYASMVSGAPDKTLHMVLINKSNTQTMNAQIQITSPNVYSRAEYYGFDGTSSVISKKGEITGISNNQFTIALPVFGVYHLVIKENLPMSLDNHSANHFNSGNTKFAGMVLSPNPTHDKLQISNVDFTQSNDVSVFNAMGDLVWQEYVPAESNTMEISLAELNPGIYIIKIGAEAQRIIIQ